MFVRKINVPISSSTAKITLASSQSRDFSSGSVGLDAAPSADGEDSTTAGSPALSKHAVSARRVATPRLR